MQILAIRSKHKDFGYKRIIPELRKLGCAANKKRVQRVIRELSLQVCFFWKKNRKHNSYRGKCGKTAPNRLNRDFKTTIPHQKIVTDTTEFKYYVKDSNGRLEIKKLYLDPFMHMYNNEIISYRISDKPSAKKHYGRTKRCAQNYARLSLQKNIPLRSRLGLSNVFLCKRIEI